MRKNIHILNHINMIYSLTPHKKNDGLEDYLFFWGGDLFFSCEMIMLGSTAVYSALKASPRVEGLGYLNFRHEKLNLSLLSLVYVI